MGKLFRVQDSAGRGPYRPGFSACWTSPEGPLNKPWWTELGITLEEGMSRVPYRMYGGSAFKSLDQLNSWFLPEEQEKLHELGYVIVRFRPDKVIAETPTQVLFAQNYPLSRLPVYGPLREPVQ